MPNEKLTIELSTAVLAEQTQLRIPSNLDWIEPTAEYLKTRALLCGACVEAQSGRLFLALHEALSNSIVHGNLEVSSQLKEEDSALFARTLAERSADPAYASRTVHISVAYNGQRCQWTLTDEGPGFDYEAILAREETGGEEAWAVSGRGILLMRALLDEVRYEAGGRRVILTLGRSNCPEKRQHPRLVVHQRVQVAPIRPDGSVDWDAAYEAVTQNLSEGGLSLLQAQLNQAERVLIGMDLEGQTIYLPAQVRHCHTVQNQVLELGCRFLLQGEVADLEDQNLESAIDALLSRLQEPATVAQERRQQRRISYTERIEVHSLSGEQSLFGYARDLSRAGISFIATDALPLEEHVLSLPRPGKALRVKSRIIRCQLIALGFYDVAASFQELA